MGPNSVDGVVDDIVRRVPAWSHAELTVRPASEHLVERGFAVGFEGRNYWVRVPAERADLLGHDRRYEREAARHAADIGVGPVVFGDLPGIGTPVTALPAGHRFDQIELAARLDAVVALLKRLHRGGPLPGLYPVHRVVEWHARDASSHGAIPPPSYERLHQQSRHIEAAFAAAPIQMRPCHNDVRLANIVVTDERLWLIDFEHAGMNDVFFDLATLSLDADFGASADELMLRHYFGEVTASAWARLQLMKVMSEFRAGMWAVVQHAVSSLELDYATYAAQHLAAAERLAAASEFPRWLQDARRSPIPGPG